MTSFGHMPVQHVAACQLGVSTLAWHQKPASTGDNDALKDSESEAKNPIIPLVFFRSRIASLSLGLRV